MVGAAEVFWDDRGVAHVRAEDEVERFRGLGYVQARDRGMQMLLSRTLAQGRLCETLADTQENLAIDKAFRRLGFHVDARDEWDKADDRLRAVLEAYCAGVDQAFAERVPWELRMLGMKRAEPWRPEDCILWGRVMGHFGLSQSQESMERFVVELVRLGIDRDLLDALLPGRLDGLDEDLVRRLHVDPPLVPADLPIEAPIFAASNNWAIAGSRTRSGAAILANDPHLEVNRLPCVWQEVVLEWSEGYAMGATVPGIPAIIIGRTRDLSWGVTYTYQDATDSWIEEVKDGRFRRDDAQNGWLDFDVREEVIQRKKNESVTIHVYENDHGTLQGEPVDGLMLTTMWAPSRGTGARSMAAFLDVLDATDVEQGAEALGRVETGWNWVLADRSGRIAYQMSGTVPRRRDGANGFVPLPGWDPANDWLGSLSPEELPRCIDPEDGYFATANDDLSAYGTAPAQNLTMGDYRARRIRDSLAARDDWTVGDARVLQLDRRSAQAERYLVGMIAHAPDAETLELLDGWDGDYAHPAGAFFEAFYRELVLDVLRGRLGGAMADYLWQHSGIIAGFHRLFDDMLLDDECPWYVDSRQDTWRRVMAKVVQAGPAPLPAFRMENILLGRKVPGVAKGPFTMRGSRASILQFQAYHVAGRFTTFAPSYRFITSMDTDEASTIVAGGPSDRPFTRHYASEVQNWLAGILLPLRPS